MRHTIGAFRLITAVLWILVLVLPATVTLSLMKIFEEGNMEIGEPSGYMSNGKLLLAIPYCIDNAGFYDLTDAGINIEVYRGNETIFALSAEIPIIPAGETVTSICNASVSLEELTSKCKYLLTTDVMLNACVSFRFQMTSAIGFKFSTTAKMPWGAPFHELSIHDITYDHVSRTLSAYVGFSNHSPFQLNGTLKVKLYSPEGEHVGSAVLDVNVPPHELFHSSFAVRIDDPYKQANGFFIQLHCMDLQILEVRWHP